MAKGIGACSQGVVQGAGSLRGPTTRYQGYNKNSNDISTGMNLHAPFLIGSYVLASSSEGDMLDFWVRRKCLL
jgi:hypothetical protein